MADFLNWTIPSCLSETFEVEEKVTQDIVKMLDEGNTVPFIARYRKEKTKNMQPKELHLLKEKYDDLKHLVEQLSGLKVKVEKLGQLTPAFEKSLRNCKTEDDLTFLAEPFKTRGSRTLCQKARDKGLEPLAMKLLECPERVNIVGDVPPAVRGEGPDAIERDVGYILADVIAKDPEVLRNMDSLLDRYPPDLESKLSRSVKADKALEAEAQKFQHYVDFSISTRRIRSFQVLAINRGEAKKVLSVKVEFRGAVKDACLQFCRRKFRTSALFQPLLEKALQDAYARLLAPHFVRAVRSRLKRTAVAESLGLFADNLRQLLMTSPVAGKAILGVDPGFTQGCKLALIGQGGEVVDTGIFYLSRREEATAVLASILKRNSCELIALGDGVGSRPAEKLLSDLCASGRLAPLRVRFCLVSECGASVYSATPLADKELAWLDVTYRGAVSIARRLQDPLSELVKIPPSSLGVGQYQHDLPERQLQARVSSILEECISMVGVDLNYAPVHVLQHVAGLNKSRATTIFDYRRLHGDFVCREQLLKVKGIGKIAFSQCAGFVRIMPPKEEEKATVFEDTDVEMIPVEDLPQPVAPSTSRGTKRKLRTPADAVERKRSSLAGCRLDSTTIHPESYAIARRIIADLGFGEGDVGGAALRDACRRARLVFRVGAAPLEEYTTEEKGLQTVVDILESLERPTHFDPREDLFKPLFRDAVQSIESLRAGQPVSGRVGNVTQFGAFVDIGVGVDALLHHTQMRHLSLGVGSRVDAVVQNVDPGRRRIGLHQATVA